MNKRTIFMFFIIGQYALKNKRNGDKVMSKSRWLSLIVAMVMMFTFVGTQLVVAYAEGEPTFTVSSETVEVGEEVTLKVEISNNPGICAAQIYIYYPQGFALKSVVDTELLKGYLAGGVLTENPYKLSWEDGGDITKPDNSGNGTVATLVFAVDSSVEAGDYEISLAYAPGDIFNMELEDVEFEMVSGIVTVEGKRCPHQNTDLRDEEEATCGAPGYSGDLWCTDCNTIIEEGIVVSATGNHADADGEWESNETVHFHTCGCGAKFDETDHNFTLEHNEIAHFEKCTECGIETEPEACTFGQWTPGDKIGTHKKTCHCGNSIVEDCKYDAAHVAGTNTHQGVCNVCGHAVEGAACVLRADAAITDKIGKAFLTTFSCADQCGNTTEERWAMVGDVSNDGKVTIADVILVLRSICELELPNSVHCELGDVFQGEGESAGVLSTTDAIMLLRYVLEK